MSSRQVLKPRYVKKSGVLTQCLSVAGAMLLSACGGGGSGEAAPEVALDTGVNDLDIAERVYDAERRTPAGFLDDPSAYPGLSEFRFHVSGQDVGLAALSAPRFEACSASFATAFDWSEEASRSRGFVSTATGNLETEWYYQVDRALDADPSAMLITRVFKCASIDRSGRDEDGNAGAIARTPVTAEDLRFVSEYLWRFSPYNNALHAVLESLPDSEPGRLHHDLFRAEAQVGAGVDGCDRIDVYRWRHTVDTTSGELTESTQWLRSFDAEVRNGLVALCGG